MLAQRTASLEHHRLDQQLTYLQNPKDHRDAVEFFARAAGYIPGEDQQDIPIDGAPARQKRDTRILTDRLSKGPRVAEDRANDISEALVQAAMGLEGYSFAAKVPRGIELRRTMFNVRLAQALVLHGVTSENLRSDLGFDHNAADRFVAKHQGAEIRDVSTAIDLLQKLNPSQAQQLAKEYFGTYSGQRRDVKQVVERVTNLPGVTEEEESSQRKHRSTFGVVALAIGAGSSPGSRSFTDYGSEMAAFLEELGLEDLDAEKLLLGMEAIRRNLRDAVSVPPLRREV